MKYWWLVPMIIFILGWVLSTAWYKKHRYDVLDPEDITDIPALLAFMFAMLASFLAAGIVIGKFL